MDDADQMPSLNEDDENVEETDNYDAQQQRDNTGALQGLRDECASVADAEEDEQPEHGTAGLSSKQERLTLQPRLNSHMSDRVGLSDAAAAVTVQASPQSPVDGGTAGTSRLSHSLSSVDSADDNVLGNEDDATLHQDNGDEQLSTGSISDLSDFNYDQSPRRYRSRTSSTSVSSRASPSLPDDNDSVDEDEVFSPQSPSFSSWTFSQSDTLDDDDDDDDDGHQGSDELSADEDTQTSSPQQTLCSHSLPRLVPDSQPVSSNVSLCEYNVGQESSNARETSSQHGCTVSGSHDSQVFVDSESDSNESWSLEDRCTVKRQRSTSSAAASDDSDGDKQHHKMRRFH